jgi:hydroxycarboxylate dehydrogenase B
MDKTNPGANPGAGLRIMPQALNALVADIWKCAGSSDYEAQLVADNLVMANLSGHDSHGVGMIPRYVRSLHAGGLVLNRHATVARDAAAILTVDGNSGFGQVVAAEAMDLGIARARKLGICAVGLRNAHHIGRIGHWAEQCARHGLVSIHFVNVAGDPLVAPFGGIDVRIGTNPFCAAFPRKGEPPLLLDFATSGIAYGKTREAYNKGLQVGPGYLIDHEGRPTIDPKVMHTEPRGSLLPLGGHKGYGLAVLCEIFGGALSGGFTTHADTVMHDGVIINCMLSVIIDPERFDAQDAQRQAADFIDWVKASPPAEGGTVRMPGEPELAMRAEREASGIPIDAQSWKQIAQAAQVVGFDAAKMDAVIKAG